VFGIKGQILCGKQFQFFKCNRYTNSPNKQMKVNRFKRMPLRNAELKVNFTLKDELRVDPNCEEWLYSVVETPSVHVRLFNLSEEEVYQRFQQEVLAWSRMKEEKSSLI